MSVRSDTRGDDSFADPIANAAETQPFVMELLANAGRASEPVSLVSVDDLSTRLKELGIEPWADPDWLASIVSHTKVPESLEIEQRTPVDVKAWRKVLLGKNRRVHGLKASPLWFPLVWLFGIGGDSFGYLSSATTRSKTRLPYDEHSKDLLTQLGAMMASETEELGSANSTIPAGFTYVGQFIDHDITLDTAPMPDKLTDARKFKNFRTPVLDLDSLYGRGPVIDAALYEFPTAGPPSAIKLRLGTNTPAGVGGSGGTSGAAGMRVSVDSDVPRTPQGTAHVGDGRNDENLIVSQFHQVMIRFHNRIVDLRLATPGFSGDIFADAKLTVIRHYQWALVNDFLRRICGDEAVDKALKLNVSPNEFFNMPVEFSVAAYRFGHSMVRPVYWITHKKIREPLSKILDFARPVPSNTVVDFNAFFETKIRVPVFNFARPIDSALALGLAQLPGFDSPPFESFMKALATRNLLRGLALGLPSGQGLATQFGITPMNAFEILDALPIEEQRFLRAGDGILLKKTPLWYYILREAKQRHQGNRLGELGAKIVADTFITMLKRDVSSYLNTPTTWTPDLLTAENTFTFADLVKFTGVTSPV